MMWRYYFRLILGQADMVHYFRMMWTHYFRLILGQADMVHYFRMMWTHYFRLILGQAGMGALLQDVVDTLLLADIGTG